MILTYFPILQVKQLEPVQQFLLRKSRQVSSTSTLKIDKNCEKSKEKAEIEKRPIKSISVKISVLKITMKCLDSGRLPSISSTFYARIFRMKVFSEAFLVTFW